MKRFLPVVLILAGLAAAVYGIALIFAPAGWIAGGIAAVALGVLMVLGEGPDGDDAGESPPDGDGGTRND